MKEKVIRGIRSRNREQWADELIARWTEARIWLQEHGEAALFIGFGLGILAVIAFHFVLIVGLILALLAAAVYFLAEPSVIEGTSGFTGPSNVDGSMNVGTRSGTVSSATTPINTRPPAAGPPAGPLASTPGQRESPSDLEPDEVKPDPVIEIVGGEKKG